MVRELKCACVEYQETDVKTWALFEQIRRFFKNQVDLGIYSDIIVEKPYYVYESDNEKIESYAEKWFSCNVCGCLWEFKHPEFPAIGFVRKFPGGIYREKGL